VSITLDRTKSLIQALETINDKQKFVSLANYRRTVYGFKILIDVMHAHLNENDEELCTKEYLTKRVSSLASRATIINFINDQVSNGTLISNTSPVDGRIRVITPSNQLETDYQSWLEHLAE